MPSVETLSRIQFALTVSFHFLFPPMTIGLGLILVIMQTLRVRTGKAMYREMARYWTRVFGLVFVLVRFPRPAPAIVRNGGLSGIGLFDPRPS